MKIKLGHMMESLQKIVQKKRFGNMLYLSMDTNGYWPEWSLEWARDIIDEIRKRS